MRLYGSLVVLAGLAMWLFFASTLGGGEGAGWQPSFTPAPETSEVNATPTPEPAFQIPETYTIEPGDTLSRIATRFRVPLDQLMEINGITNPGSIRAGDVLRLPQPDQQ